MISRVSVDQKIQTKSHLLCRSVTIRMYGSPVTCLSCNLPEKSICISCPASVITGKQIFWVTAYCYFKVLPEFMQAVPVLHVSSTSFCILAHWNMLLSASISVELWCPRSSVSTTCVLNSSGITSLSPVKSEMNAPVSAMKSGEISPGARSFIHFVEKFAIATVAEKPKFSGLEFSPPP